MKAEEADLGNRAIDCDWVCMYINCGVLLTSTLGVCFVSEGIEDESNLYSRRNGAFRRNRSILRYLNG